MAGIQGVAESEIVKRALALYDLALKEQYAGNKLSIINDGRIIRNIQL